MRKIIPAHWFPCFYVTYDIKRSSCTLWLSNQSTCANISDICTAWFSRQSTCAKSTSTSTPYFQATTTQTQIRALDSLDTIWEHLCKIVKGFAQYGSHLGAPAQTKQNLKAAEIPPGWHAGRKKRNKYLMDGAKAPYYNSMCFILCNPSAL